MKSRNFHVLQCMLCVAIVFLQSSTAFAQWEKLPGPTGGRINQLLSVGNDLYAVVWEGGGVFKSADNGFTWTDVTPESSSNFLPDELGAVHFTGTNLLVAINGEIFVSGDNGSSWQVSNFGSVVTSFSKNVFAFTEHNGVTIAGSNGSGMYISSDDGLTWTASSSGLPTPFATVWNLVSDGTVLLAGIGGSSNGLYRSDDDGASWQIVSSGIPTDNYPRAITKAGVNYLVSFPGTGIFLSTDLTSWTNVHGPGPITNQAFILPFGAQGSRLFAAVEASGYLFISEDDGLTWSHLATSGLETVGIQSIVEHNGELFAGNTLGVRVSGDLGVSWTPRQTGLTGLNTNGILEYGGYIFAATHDGVHRSSDGGQTWERTFTGIGPFVEVIKEFDGTIYIGNSALGSFSGGMYKSSDLGDTWSNISPSTYSRILDIVKINSRLFASNAFGGVIYYSDDDGTTWTGITNGLPSTTYAFSLAEFEGSIYAALANSSGYSSGSVYRSDDNGDSWYLFNDNTNASEGPLYIDAYEFLVTPGSLRVFTDNFVYELNPTQTAWTKTGSQISNGKSALALSESVFLAGTFGRGIYLSLDGGETWIQDSDLGNAEINDVKQIGADVYVGITGNGVHKRPVADFLPNVDCPVAGNFEIKDQEVNCSSSSILVPVDAIGEVSGGVIGLDFCLQYDATYLSPSGNAFVKDVAHGGNPGYVSYFLNTTTPGQVNGILYFNGSAPFPSYFSGSGSVVDIEFDIIAEAPPGTELVFSLCGVTESTLFNGDFDHCSASDGTFTVVNDPTSIGTVLFWGKGGKPLQYDPLNPSAFIATEVSGSDELCGPTGTQIFNTDMAGQFVYEVDEGDYINIRRDIPGVYGDNTICTDMMSWINGTDQNRAMKIATLDPAFVPSVYQILAADVNRDGKITAADVTLISARSVMSICAFTSDGANSLDDWMFIDGQTLAGDPSFTVSATYPAADGAGFSKNAVPIVPDCLPVPIDISASCNATMNETYHAILLGDVNGNWKSVDGGNARTLEQMLAGSLMLDVEEDGEGVATTIDVYYEFEEKVESVDFSLKLPEDVDPSDLSVTSPDADLRYNYNIRGGQVLVSAYWLSERPKSGYLLQLKLDNHVVDQAEIVDRKAWINSEPARFEDGSSILVVEVSVDGLRLYPNPVADFINIDWMQLGASQGWVSIYDASGRKAGKHRIIRGKNAIDISGLKKGVYFLLLDDGKVNQTHRIIKTN